MTQVPPRIMFCSPGFVQIVPMHEYNDLQRAIDDIPAFGQYTIKLYDDFMGIPEIRLTNNNVQITIDGQGEYGIIFDTGTPICQIEASRTLKFVNMSFVRGDLITVRKDSNIWFDNCKSVMTSVDMVDGKYSDVYILNTKMYGADNTPALTMYDSGCRATIYESYVQGGTRSPAMYFNVESNDKVKIRNSVVLHNTGDAYPIERNGDVFVGIKAYNCVGLGMLCSHDITNFIAANNNNMNDPDITF